MTWDLLRALQAQEFSVALTPEDLGKIAEIVKTAIGDHPCRFPLTDEQVTDISRVATVVEDLGDGDIRRGVAIVRSNHAEMRERHAEIEQIRANHDFVASLREDWPRLIKCIEHACAMLEAARDIRKYATRAIVATSITAILAAIWIAIKMGGRA